jgi:predicted Rossmann-fold nucleotide-binding protein
LTDKVATNHFYGRLQNLIERSVGFVAIRGGMGTVTEISLVWNKLQTGVINKRPLVLLGECWKPVVEAWQKNLVVSSNDISFLDFADNAEEAAKIIVEKSRGVIV